MPSDVKTKVQNSFSGRQYSFASNGTLSVSWQSALGSKTETGTWSVNQSTLTMVVNGDQRKYTMAMEGDNLVLSMNNTTTGATFSKLVLKKN